ncbi:MAG: sulfotransferase-like domain-containing protein [Actinomycetes bacterium]
MWSGPRNISTAMMRSWGARPGCVVVDEPFYAFYLTVTGLDHPGRDEIVRSQPTDWANVARQLTEGPLPDGTAVYYQKHMTHHLLPDIDRSRLRGLRHAFLVRDPAEVLASYARVRAEPTLEDLGLPQQVELYERFGGPVLDARDVLLDPPAALRALCDAVGVPYDPSMLSWPAGPQDCDGVWGPHWYDRVWRSTGFSPYTPPDDALPAHLQPLLDRCRPCYDRLAEHRLRP